MVKIVMTRSMVTNLMEQHNKNVDAMVASVGRSVVAASTVAYSAGGGYHQLITTIVFGKE